ncbi:hypothetical protein EJ08DRAFT_593750, partial [Tothia fuscella]
IAKSLKEAAHELFREAKKSRSVMQRLLNRSAEGAGSRVFPLQQAKKDEKFGIRIDKGSVVDGLVELNLQINSNATKRTLQPLVRKNGSQKKYVTVKVDPKQEASEENFNKLEDHFADELDASKDI